jgi:DNA-3-methyladenine glycosylase II
LQRGEVEAYSEFVKSSKSKYSKLIIDKKKLRALTPADNYFLALLRSIVYQQISTKAGNSIFAKVLKLFGKKKVTPKTLLTFSNIELRGAGLSESKMKYVRDLAEKFLDKTIDPTHFHSMSDQEIKDHLIQVKGIGPWTADMFLIFALNRPNILPVGDLAIVKGFMKAFKLRKTPDEKQMRKLAAAHEGEHTTLSLHLWRIMDEESGADWE